MRRGGALTERILKHRGGDGRNGDLLSQLILFMFSCSQSQSSAFPPIPSSSGSAIQSPWKAWEVYSDRTQDTVDIERHRKLEFRAGLLQLSGIILDQHIL